MKACSFFPAATAVIQDFTQDVCDVCQIDTGYVQKAVSSLTKQPQLIPLAPKDLAEVFSNAASIAGALERQENAYRHPEFSKDPYHAQV